MDLSFGFDNQLKLDLGPLSLDFKSRAAVEVQRETVSKELNSLHKKHATGGDTQTNKGAKPKPFGPFAALCAHCGNHVPPGLPLPPAWYPGGEGKTTPNDLPADPMIPPKGAKPHPTKPLEEPLKVCIVGSGMSGLYTALILEDLAAQLPETLPLCIDILEADSRPGGRVYTHHFDKDTAHQYYDIGAMRFPMIPIMDRTFDLFKRTNVSLREYYLDGPNCPKMFNGNFFQPHSADAPDPYRVGVKSGGSVPDYVVDKHDRLLNEAFQPWIKGLKEDFRKGLKTLMEETDMYSVREYLKTGGPIDKATGEPRGKKYDFFSIQWMESMSSSSGKLDLAFSESVLETMTFEYESDVQWRCIDGGSSMLVDAMTGMLKTKVQLNKHVEAIIHDRRISGANMSVKITGETSESPLLAEDGKKPEATAYDTVFATTTLACLSRMDLSTLDLHPTTKDAIRCLHYDDSVKVAVRFKYPWWITRSEITRGGVARTDLPIRVCVYPSYNIDDPVDQPAVLLVSYTWTQDASRIGSLVDAGEEAERELADVVLRDLARLHSRAGAHPVTEKDIRAAYDGQIHAFSWTHNPYTSGAFAMFGPGQFTNLYPYLVRPAADAKFHIVGEAASAHHAWIVGSLESAWMAVYKFLRRFERMDALRALEERWGTVPEMETGQKGFAHLLVNLGTLKKGEHVRV